MNYFAVVVPHLVGNIPVLLAWLVGIALVVHMLRRGGGKAEKLLLTGCSLMFVAQIASPFLSGLALWLTVEHGMMSRASVAGLVVSLTLGILNMAGIVCLILAFWTRWKTTAATQ